MAEVTYFQRYSQRENHVTNNTLLVLRHFYQAAPLKLEQVLVELTGQNEVKVGPTFEQQMRGSASVPDGLITQAPFRIYLETKRGGAPGLDQLKRHLDSIQASPTHFAGGAYLMALSTEAMAPTLRDLVLQEAHQRKVAFAAVTFADVLQALEAACADHEGPLKAVLDDYRAYLESENLLFEPDDWMLVVPCGISFDENRKFGVYYEGEDRPARSKCAYLGAYRQKQIGLVGRVETVLVCQYQNGNVEPLQVERGEATPEALSRIEGIIEATPYYDLKSTPQRYWVMDELAPTALVKRDKGPIRGAQYLQISPLLRMGETSRDLSAPQLAERLNGRAFPATDELA